MEENRMISIKESPWFYVLRGVIIFAVTMILYSITVYRVRVTYLTNNMQFIDIPVWSINLISTVILGLIYNSVVMLVSMHDKFASREFFEEDKRELYCLEELSVVLKDKKFWIETLTALTAFFIVAFSGGFGSVAFSLPSNVTSRLPYWLLPLLYCAVIFFFVSLWCKYEARRYWLAQKIKHETETIGSAFKIITRGIGISFVYPFVFPYLPLLVLVSISVVNIARAASEYFGIIGLIFLIILVILVIAGIKISRALKSRKKFIKELKQVCEENGYILSEIYHPYSSFFKHHDGYSFTLKKDDREFTCLLLPTMNKRTPVVFTGPDSGYYQHRIGGKKHHITIQHKFNYGFDRVGNSTKLVVVQPFPKRLIVESDGGSRIMNPGDKIWDIVVYEQRSFVGAIDRDCLGRYNGRYD